MLVMWFSNPKLILTLEGLYAILLVGIKALTAISNDAMTKKHNMRNNIKL